MPINIPVVPEGITHEPDLSKLSPDELRKHHNRGLRHADFHSGMDGVQAYKQRYPEAASQIVKHTTIVFTPKPKGYVDAIAAIVGAWLTDDAALGRTNRRDVETLNAALGTRRFDPDRFFSKPIGKPIKKRLRELFAARGHTLPDTVDTLSKVRKAAKAARAGTLPHGKPFGNVGTIAGDTLALGGATFRIEQHHDRDCIRVTAEGETQRLYLSTVLALLAGLQNRAQAGDSPLPTSIYRIGELARRSETPAATGAPPDPRASSLGELAPTPDPLEDDPLGNLPASAPDADEDADPPSLSERITRLAANYARPPAEASPGTDPLEMTADEFADFRC